MELNELPDVNPAKLAQLRQRMDRLGVRAGEIEESFSRGGGKGGQKINKTSNCVLLRYPRFGLVVRCQRERRRSLNRFLALRELVDRVEMLVSPGTSQRLALRDRIRRRKHRRRGAVSAGHETADCDRGPELGQDGTAGAGGPETA